MPLNGVILIITLFITNLLSPLPLQVEGSTRISESQVEDFGALGFRSRALWVSFWHVGLGGLGV